MGWVRLYGAMGLSIKENGLEERWREGEFRRRRKERDMKVSGLGGRGRGRVVKSGRVVRSMMGVGWIIRWMVRECLPTPTAPPTTDNSQPATDTAPAS